MARPVPLLAAEGWSFEETEIARLSRLGGTLAALDAGRLVGFLTYVDFPPMRFIGNVVVDPAQRGQGVGARLVHAACDGAPRVGLYAVEKAVTLYERAGFQRHGGEVLAMRAPEARALRPTVTQRMTRADLLEAQRLDREATGMDRAYLLRELLAAYPDSARVVRESGRLVAFGFAKPSPGVTEIGPLVGLDRDSADAILDELLATTTGPHEMGILADNRKSLGSARERGFEQTFRAIPMFRGEPPAWKAPRILAVAGLEKG